MSEAPIESTPTSLLATFTADELKPFTIDTDENIEPALFEHIAKDVVVYCQRYCYNDADKAMSKKITVEAVLKVGNKLGETTIVLDDEDETEIKGKFKTRLKKLLTLLTSKDFMHHRWQGVESGIGYFLNSSVYYGDKISGYYDVHYDVDWDAGDYGEERRSCWWRYEDWSVGRLDFRYNCELKNAFALRLYNADKTPIGRCFVFYNEDKTNIVFFNAYAPSIDSVYPFFTKLFKQILGAEYAATRVNLSLNSDLDNLYRNGIDICLHKVGDDVPDIGSGNNVYFHHIEHYMWGHNRAWEHDRDDAITEYNDEDDDDYYDDEDDYDDED